MPWYQALSGADTDQSARMLAWTYVYARIIKCFKHLTYRQSGAKSQNLNIFRLLLKLFLPNLLKPCVKSRMKIQLEQDRQAMFQLYLSDQQLIAY